MEQMFKGCKNLKEIKGINKFNTDEVTNMCGMFYDCNELEHLDLSNFNTSNVSNKGGIFSEYNKLKEIKCINSI